MLPCVNAVLFFCLSVVKEAEKWKGLHPARLFLKLRKLQLANAKTSKYVYRKKQKGGIVVIVAHCLPPFPIVYSVGTHALN